MTRYRTTIAGRRVIQHPSTSTFDHVQAALSSARNGETAWIKASDGPGSAWYAVEYRRVDDRVTVTPTVDNRRLDPSMPDFPTWMREVLTMTQRLLEGITDE